MGGEQEDFHYFRAKKENGGFTSFLKDFGEKR